MQTRNKITFLFLFLILLISGVVFASPELPDLNGKLISGIGISGNYPYIESRIRRYLTVRPSDHYNEAIATEQVQRIKDFYKRDGWFETEVRMEPEYIPTTDSVWLNIKIKHGHLLRYRNIVVKGVHSLPTSLVATKINTWKQYQPRRLRESLKAIVAVYKSAGFPLARARLTNTYEDPLANKIDVEITVEEGPKVEVQFTGNHNLGGKQLAKVITIFYEGAIDTFELEESAKNIQRRYIQRGFPNSVVRFDRKEISKDHVLILFKISEGTPERIRRIEFSGNGNFKRNKVKRAIESKELSLFHPGIFSRKVIKDDPERLKLFYKSEGFPDPQAEAPTIEKLHKKTQLIVTFPLNEGQRFILDDIVFNGDPPFTNKAMKKALKAKQNKPIDYNLLEEDRMNIQNFLADRGYPYSTVALDVEEDETTGKANFVFAIQTGPAVTFGPITIEGDFLTAQKAIHSAMSIKEGAPFSFKNIVDSKVGLRRLGAFNSVNVIPTGLDEKATTIPVLIKIEEARPFKLDFDVGFSTDERLIGGINFVNRNAFGWGKSMSLDLIGGQRLSRGELAWTDPKLAGSEIEMTTSGWLQYENLAVFNYVQAGGGVGFSRRYHRTSFLVRTNLTRNYFLTGSSTAADAESLRNNTLFNTLLSASVDTRNNFADPTKGNFAQGYSNFFNEIRGKNAHFVKLGILGGDYRTAIGIFTLANDVRFEGIETFEKNTSIPSNALYLLGGDNTIRGYERDSLGPVDAAGKATGGRIRLIVNNELRIKLLGPLKGVVFHDMGFLTNNFTAVTAGQLRHSVGLGLHYITPIGPIKADYGFIIDRRAGEHIGRFHLTFGYVF